MMCSPVSALCLNKRYIKCIDPKMLHANLKLKNFIFYQTSLATDPQLKTREIHGICLGYFRTFSVSFEFLPSMIHGLHIGFTC